MNFNGESTASATLAAHACHAPDPPGSPQRVSGDATSITVSWAGPSDEGGCPITNYQLWRDTGSGLSSTFSEVDASSVNNRPALREHEVTLTSSETGLPMRFKLTAHNTEGSATSEIS
mmetsp:Transcript_23476/g.36166  ORF Transcript_23476/g.36166 Transcript_23476/m.36166 type:complete len:118 (-) Transcript_23476:99-452(-)